MGREEGIQMTRLALGKSCVCVWISVQNASRTHGVSSEQASKAHDFECFRVGGREMELVWADGVFCMGVKLSWEEVAEMLGRPYVGADEDTRALLEFGRTKLGVPMARLRLEVDADGVAIVGRSVACEVCGKRPAFPVMWKDDESRREFVWLCAECDDAELRALQRELDEGDEA